MLTEWLARLRGKRVREVDAAALETALRSERPPVVLDLRGAEQFATGHLPGALHLPLDRLEAEAARLDRSAPTVVY